MFFSQLTMIGSGRTAAIAEISLGAFVPCLSGLNTALSVFLNNI